MRIQTSNKLAHLQAEYQELSEQTKALESQVSPLQCQVNQLYQYISVNSGDRKLLASYKDLNRKLQTLVNTIRRNNNRLASLQMRIVTECGRVQAQEQKMAMNMQRQAQRSAMSQMKSQARMYNTAYRNGFK